MREFIKVQKSENTDGLDMRFAVNYFAPYLLTNELLPVIEKSEDARIINLSSAAQSPVSFEALTGYERLSENATYAQSKLALTMWSFYLAQNTPGCFGDRRKSGIAAQYKNGQRSLRKFPFFSR